MTAYNVMMTVQVKFWVGELAKEVTERLLKDRENVSGPSVFASLC